MERNPNPSYEFTGTIHCSVCGLMHPPVKNGDCPLKPIEGISNEKLNHILSSIKTIIKFNFEKKNIKDSDKFLKDLIIHLTTFSENYKDE